MVNGQYLLLVRVEDRRGISHLCAARSANGVAGWEIDRLPTFWPQPEECPEETWRIEDPRITWMEDLELWIVAYTACLEVGRLVALASTMKASGVFQWLAYKSFEVAKGKVFLLCSAP